LILQTADGIMRIRQVVHEYPNVFEPLKYGDVDIGRFFKHPRVKFEPAQFPVNINGRLRL
jgi:hypothetical protein